MCSMQAAENITQFVEKHSPSGEARHGQTVPAEPAEAGGGASAFDTKTLLECRVLSTGPCHLLLVVRQSERQIGVGNVSERDNSF